MTTFEQTLLELEGFEDEFHWMEENGDWWPEYVEHRKQDLLNNDDYLLVKIMEEASEVAQAASKVLLFSAEHKHYGEGSISNLENFLNEVEDLKVLLALYSKTKSLPYQMVYPKEKVEKLLVYGLLSKERRRLATANKTV